MKVDRIKGINNRRPLEALGRTSTQTDTGAYFVADAVNVDLDPSQKPRLRPGYTMVQPGASSRGLFAVKDESYAYVGVGSQLMHFDGTTMEAVGVLASPTVPLAYVETPLGVVCSDTIRMQLLRGKISRDLVPAAPNPVPSVSSLGAGMLQAGQYGVIFVTENALGQRSAFTPPVYVNALANSAFTFSRPTSTQRVAIYITALDGEIFYRSATLEPNQTTLTLVASYTDGEPISYTHAVASMPAGHVLGYHNGRLLSGMEDVVFVSMPYTPGLYRVARDFIPLGERATMILGVEAGVFIGTASCCYFLPGGDPTAADLNEIATFGIVEGTLARMPNSLDWMVFTARGPARLTAEGGLQLLQDENMTFEPANIGASLVREQDGLRTLITSLRNVGQEGAYVGSFMKFEQG